MKKKVLMLGLDALVANLIEKFCEEGILPNVERLIEGGCFTRLLSSIPAQTPANWHTVATGATPGTHSVAVWGAHYPTDPIWEVHRPEAFNSGLCRAEYIWETASRAGRKSVVMNYAGFPPTNDKTLHIDYLYHPLRSYYDVAPPTVYHNLDCEAGQRLDFSRVDAATQAPHSSIPPLEATVEVSPSTEGSGPTYQALLCGDSTGYDRLLLRSSPDAEPLSLRPQQWSPWLREEFDMAEMGRVEGAFRFRLLECAEDGSRFRLYRTAAFPTDGRFVSDPELGRTLVEDLGPYINTANCIGLQINANLLDFETMDEMLTEEAQWWSKAAQMAMSETGAELLYLHWHMPDSIAHRYIPWVDPRGASFTPQKAREGWKALRNYYRAADRFVGEFLDKFPPEENVFAVVAEHGMPANKRAVSLVNVFKEKGWIKVTPDGKDIDWAASKLFYSQNHLWINLQGREPTGVVPPGHYEELRAEVQRVMRDLKDPQTGGHVFSFVLTREEAPVVGLHGEAIGDLVFCYRGGYRWSEAEVLKLGEGRVVFPSTGGNHGPMIPSYETETTSVYGLLIMAGPGVKKGVREEPPQKGTRRTVDVAPTLAHLLGIDPPAQNEGRLLHEFLEGFDAQSPSRTLTPTERDLVPKGERKNKITLKGDVTDEEE